MFITMFLFFLLVILIELIQSTVRIKASSSKRRQLSKICLISPGCPNLCSSMLCLLTSALSGNWQVIFLPFSHWFLICNKYINASIIHCEADFEQTMKPNGLFRLFLESIGEFRFICLEFCKKLIFYHHLLSSQPCVSCFKELHSV